MNEFTAASWMGKIKMRVGTLASFAVSTCVSGGGGGTGAEARAHNAQVFAREAGLLLQLALTQRRQERRRSWNVCRGGRVGQEKKKRAERLSVIWMRRCAQSPADVCSSARSKLKKCTWINDEKRLSSIRRRLMSFKPRQPFISRCVLVLLWWAAGNCTRHWKIAAEALSTSPESSHRSREKSKSAFRVKVFSPCHYLWGVVVSVRATHRWGRSHGTRLAAALLDLQLSGLLDPASQTQGRGISIHQANREGSLFIVFFVRH